MATVGSVRQIAQEMAAVERSVLAAWLRIIGAVREGVSLRRVIDALDEGEDAIADLLITSADLTPLLEEVRDAYERGGGSLTNRIPKRARDPRGGRMVFRFDISDPEAVAWLANKSSDMITRLTGQEQREAIREILAGAMETGRGPRSTALDIVGRINPTTGRREGGIIGLNRPQARALSNARRELMEGRYHDFMARKRRDRRFDRSLERAMRTGEPLSQRHIDRILERYSDRLLNLRGETIARTESLNAYTAGREEAKRQLIESGKVAPEYVTRRWDATGDMRTREDHIRMHGTTVTGLEPFMLPDGSQMMAPRDTSLGAGPEQVINCRCLEVLEIDFIGNAARSV